MEASTKVTTKTTIEIDLEAEDVRAAMIAFAKQKYPELPWEAEVYANINANEEGELFGGFVKLTKTN